MRSNNILTLLQIHKFFWPKGGADIHYLDLIELLIKNHRNVIPFSMRVSVQERARIPDSLMGLYREFEKYFVDPVDFGTLPHALTRFWYKDAQVRLGKLLDDLSVPGRSGASSQPLIAHLHNIYHQISPSIIPVLQERRIPIVMTVHDLSLLSPILAENSIEAAIFSLEIALQQRVYRRIDRFIAPSLYVKQRLVAAGFDRRKIRHIPHFVEIGATGGIAENFVKRITKKDSRKRRRIVYFGRLSHEKGVDILIDAFHRSRYEGELLIIGDGPECRVLEKMGRSGERSAQIRFLGHIDQQTLFDHVAASELSVSPSRVPETFGLSALEAMKLGTPVIAGKEGAIAELIKNNENGLVLPKLTRASLTDALNHAWDKPEWIFALGEEAKNIAATTKSQYYERLMDVYHELL